MVPMITVDGWKKFKKIPPVEVGSVVEIYHHSSGFFITSQVVVRRISEPSTVSKWRFFLFDWDGGGITLPETNSELTPEN